MSEKTGNSPLMLKKIPLKYNYDFNNSFNKPSGSYLWAWASRRRVGLKLWIAIKQGFVFMVTVERLPELKPILLLRMHCNIQWSTAVSGFFMKGQKDTSGLKGTCCWIWWPEFDSKNPQGGKRKQTIACCPLHKSHSVITFTHIHTTHTPHVHSSGGTFNAC